LDSIWLASPLCGGNAMLLFCFYCCGHQVPSQQRKLQQHFLPHSTTGHVRRIAARGVKENPLSKLGALKPRIAAAPLPQMLLSAHFFFREQTEPCHEFCYFFLRVGMHS
ncbi:unnamed protein product, partial [Pylaiella littoralis]